MNNDPQQQDLFTDIKGMVHRAPLSTEVAAAEFIARKRTELHDRCLRAFRKFGPMTDAELETLDEFATYGPSTIRKRRSELYQYGVLEICGERRNDRGRPMKVWQITPAPELCPWCGQKPHRCMCRDSDP